VRRKLAPSRAAAQRVIGQGWVEVDGLPAAKPATLVDAGASVRLVAEPARFVGRGGLKLDAALDGFAIDVLDRRALDVGASTGGFTDCLLQRGAASVVALDVGYGQLDWGLRQRSEVVVVERTNFRHADLAALGAPFDVVVADLSFISLGTVAAQLAAAGAAGSDYVLLVKPQFEVGKGQVGKGGIVRDPGLHRSALISVAEALEAVGLGSRGVVPSPVTGAKGNREFLLWAQPGAPTIDADQIDEVVKP
jgi:23S rRNA (cytidine1920-2'-O)/16S rRNA (cytidine1409-2'-O)-methyltransferase